MKNTILFLLTICLAGSAPCWETIPVNEVAACYNSSNMRWKIPNPPLARIGESAIQFGSKLIIHFNVPENIGQYQALVLGLGGLYVQMVDKCGSEPIPKFRIAVVWAGPDSINPRWDYDEWTNTLSPPITIPFVGQSSKLIVLGHFGEDPAWDGLYDFLVHNTEPGEGINIRIESPDSSGVALITSGVEAWLVGTTDISHETTLLNQGSTGLRYLFPALPHDTTCLISAIIQRKPHSDVFMPFHIENAGEIFTGNVWTPFADQDTVRFTRYWMDSSLWENHNRVELYLGDSTCTNAGVSQVTIRRHP